MLKRRKTMYELNTVAIGSEGIYIDGMEIKGVTKYVVENSVEGEKPTRNLKIHLECVITDPPITVNQE